MTSGTSHDEPKELTIYPKKQGPIRLPHHQSGICTWTVPLLLNILEGASICKAHMGCQLTYKLASNSLLSVM